MEFFFLDELPEFNKNTLEVLRQPMEDGFVTISRVNASLSYPAKFMMIASMNPCPVDTMVIHIMNVPVHKLV